MLNCVSPPRSDLMARPQAEGRQSTHPVRAQGLNRGPISRRGQERCHRRPRDAWPG